MVVKGEKEEAVQVKDVKVEDEKPKRTNKTIYSNPAMVVIGEKRTFHVDKEVAEAFIGKELKEDEKAELFLLYRTYELEIVTTKTVKAK